MGRAYKYVILGGGNAAGYVAHEFCAQGVGPGELCIISEEAVAPYERPALSKGFLLSEGAVRLPSFHTCVGGGHERQPPKWYQDHGIELLLSTRIIATDVKKKTLTTRAGETITYKTLIIATGARVLKLEEFGVTGADSKNICYLRDLNDANHLVGTMAACKGGKAVVIGGGYIGMEATAALVSNSISVTLVFPEPHIMARLFSPEIAEFYEEMYRSKGVNFVKGTVITSFECDDSGKVVNVLLKDGTRLAADMVVVGIGIRANTSLFESQLAIEKGGIKVNGKFRTSVNSVYAIGDVAAFPLKLYNDVRRLEHVDHARKSACHVVSAILSPEKTPDYDYLPYFYSRVFSLSWQFYGDNVGKCVLFGEKGRSKFGAYWVNEGKIVGCFLEGGCQEEYSAMAKAARSQPSVSDISSLSNLGLKFVLGLGEESNVASHSTRKEEKNFPALEIFHSDKKFLYAQATAGVVVAAAVVCLGVWYAGIRKRWK